MEQWINAGDILLRSILSLIILFILARFMGRKQISQMSFFDYIVGISIGSIAASMAIDQDSDYIDGIIAMVVYAAVAILLSYLDLKFFGLRRLINGTPVIVISNGKLLPKNMRRVRMDLDRLLSEARIAGYFSLADLKFAVVESNGRISFMPFEDKRPAQTGDIPCVPSPETLAAKVIEDGKIMEANLRASGKDTVWLRKQLDISGKTVREVFLAYIDSSDNLAIIEVGDSKVDNNRNVLE